MITPEQRDLLLLLAERPGRHGDCRGPALDGLVKLGLAEIQPGTFAGHREPLPSDAVRLTKTGRKVVRQLRDDA